MKTLSILILSVLFLSSCEKKCLECETQRTKREFCSGEPQYENIKDGQVVRDQYGYEFNCK